MKGIHNYTQLSLLPRILNSFRFNAHTHSVSLEHTNLFLKRALNPSVHICHMANCYFPFAGGGPYWACAFPMWYRPFLSVDRRVAWWEVVYCCYFWVVWLDSAIYQHNDLRLTEQFCLACVMTKENVWLVTWGLVSLSSVQSGPESPSAHAEGRGWPKDIKDSCSGILVDVLFVMLCLGFFNLTFFCILWVHIMCLYWLCVCMYMFHLFISFVFFSVFLISLRHDLFQCYSLFAREREEGVELNMCGSGEDQGRFRGGEIQICL